MQHLIGQSFSLGRGNYQVVDIRRLNGETLVYAEKEENRDAAGSAATPVLSGKHPQRMAFHYSDIAELLETVSNKIA